MEWEIIISLFDWELLVSTLSFLLGIVSFTAYAWVRTNKEINIYVHTDITFISKNININWVINSIVHPSKLYLLLKQVRLYKMRQSRVIISQFI